MSVSLVAELGRDALSPAEIEKLQDVSDRYRNQSEWEISEASHEFPEWRQHWAENRSTQIPWEDVLRAQNKEDMIEVVKEDQAV